METAILGMMVVILAWAVIWQRILISRDRATIEKRSATINELRSQKWEREWDDEECQRWRDFPIDVRSNALDRIERMAIKARVFPMPDEFRALVSEVEGYRMTDYPEPD